MKFERLGEKITQIRGISYKPNDISATPLTDYVPILKANNIQEEGIVTNDLIYIHKSKVRPEQFIKKGDLLLAASSGSKEIVGKNIYFESDFEGSFGAFCKLVRPKQNINARYLATFFKSVPYKRHIRRLLSGALINNLKNEYIDSLLIPDISNSEQIHIANLLSKAENLIAQRKESIRLLDEFLKSTFSDLFGNPVTNKQKFKTVKLKDLTTFLTSGGRGWGEYYSSQGDRFIRSLDVQMNYISEENAAFVNPPNNQEANRTKVQDLDILLTITGSKIGRVAMVPKNFGTAYVSQHVAIIRTRDINPIYLSYYLSDINCGQYLIQKSFYGQTKPGLNFKQIENFEIIIPPLELQTQFAQIVEKTEALKTQYQQSLQELEQLYGSLSQTAFRGELSVKEISVNGTESLHFI